MAFSFKSLNRANGVRPEGLDTDGFEYTKLSEYEGETIKVKGFFFTNGEYGKQAVIITDDCFVNMPARAVEELEGIADNPEARAAVLAGEMIITDIEQVKTKRGKNTTAYKYGDVADLKKKK